MGAKISKKKGKYDAVKAQKKVEIIKHVDLPHSYFYKAPDTNLVTLRSNSKYKPQYLSQQFEVEHNVTYQRHAQSVMDVRDEEYNLYEEIPARELPAPRAKFEPPAAQAKFEPPTPQAKLEPSTPPTKFVPPTPGEGIVDNHNPSEVESKVQSDNVVEPTPEQQLLGVVEKMKAVKKRIKNFDGNDDANKIRAILNEYIAELNAVKSTKPTLLELRAALITKSEHFLQALAEKEAKLKPVKLEVEKVEVEKPAKAYQQVVFDIFAQVTSDLDVLKENIIDYYGTSEGVECKRIDARLDECIETVKSVDPKGDFRIVVAKEEYEDYISRLQVQFDKIVSENEKTFLIDKKTLSTVAKRDNRRKRSQIYFPENDGKLQIPQVVITGGQFSVNTSEGQASETEKVLQHTTEKSIYEDEEDKYNSGAATGQKEKMEEHNTAVVKEDSEVTYDFIQEEYNFVQVPNVEVEVYENAKVENAIARATKDFEPEEDNFVRQSNAAGEHQPQYQASKYAKLSNTPEVKLGEYQNLSEDTTLYQNHTADSNSASLKLDEYNFVRQSNAAEENLHQNHPAESDRPSSNLDEYNFIRQNNVPEEHQYLNTQEMKTSAVQQDIKMLTPNTLGVVNSRLKRQLSRQASTLTETTDDEFYDCFDDIPLDTDFESPDEEFQDSENFQSSRPQSGFAEIFGGLGETLPEQLDKDDDTIGDQVPVDNDVTQEKTKEDITSKRTSVTDSALFEVQFICQYFIQVEKQAALSDITICKRTDHYSENSVEKEKLNVNHQDEKESQESKRASLTDSVLFETQFICQYFIQVERQAALSDNEIWKIRNSHSKNSAKMEDQQTSQEPKSETNDTSKCFTPEENIEEIEKDFTSKRTSTTDSNLFEMQFICLQFIRSERQAALEDSQINNYRNEQQNRPGIQAKQEDEDKSIGSENIISPIERRETFEDEVQKETDSSKNELLFINVEQTDKALESKDQTAYVIEINIPGEEQIINTASSKIPTSDDQLHETLDADINYRKYHENVDKSPPNVEDMTGNIHAENNLKKLAEADQCDNERLVQESGDEQVESFNCHSTDDSKLSNGADESRETEGNTRNNRETTKESLDMCIDQNISIEVNVPRFRDENPSDTETGSTTVDNKKLDNSDNNTTIDIGVSRRKENVDSAPESESTNTKHQKLHPNNTVAKMLENKSDLDKKSPQLSCSEGNKAFSTEEGQSKNCNNETSASESDWYKIFGIKNIKSFSTKSNYISQEEEAMPTKELIDCDTKAEITCDVKDKNPIQEKIISPVHEILPVLQTDNGELGHKAVESNQSKVVQEFNLFDIDTTLEEPYYRPNEEPSDLPVSKEQMYNDPTYLPTYNQALELQNNKLHAEPYSNSLLDLYQDNRVSSPSFRKLDVIAEDDISIDPKSEDNRNGQPGDVIKPTSVQGTQKEHNGNPGAAAFGTVNTNSSLEQNTQERIKSSYFLNTKESTITSKSNLATSDQHKDITKEESDAEDFQNKRRSSYKQTRIKLPIITKQTLDQSKDFSEEERDTLGDLPSSETPWLQEIETVEECVEDMKLCIRDFEGTPKDEIYLNIYENLFNCMSILNKVKSSNTIIIGRKQTILNDIRACMQELEVKATTT